MHKTEGHIFIILGGIFYGTIPIFATLLSRYDVSTIEQICIRLTLCILIFLTYFGISKNKRLSLQKQDYPKFFLFGLVGIALFFTLYLSAAVMTSVTVTVLLLYTQPIYTLILSRLLLKKSITLTGFLAVALAISGIAVIFKIWSIDWEQFGLGHLFGALTGLCYSIYIFFMRKHTPKYGTTVVTFWSFLFGLIWMIPIWIIFRITFDIPEMTSFSLNLPTNAWLLLLGLTAIPTLIGYLVFNHGMKYVEPHKAGVLVLSEPLSAILMSALILSQPLVLTDLLGGVLILISFFMAKREK
jgi:drug/metabolite transporter, DME family